MLMLWFLDNDSSMTINERRIETLYPESCAFALEYNTVEDLIKIQDAFWNRKLGLNDNVFDAFLFYFGEFIEEAKQMKPCEYYNGNYCIRCIEDIKTYKLT